MRMGLSRLVFQLKCIEYTTPAAIATPSDLYRRLSVFIKNNYNSIIYEIQAQEKKNIADKSNNRAAKHDGATLDNRLTPDFESGFTKKPKVFPDLSDKSVVAEKNWGLKGGDEKHRDRRRQP
jgi:hypothetical protein